MGDIVWHGHHESDCPLEELDGTIEGRRQDIIAQKPRDEHELRLRLLRPASPEAVEAWAAYRAALAPPLQPILALHAIECLDCPWDGHSIFGGTS